MVPGQTLPGQDSRVRTRTQRPGLARRHSPSCPHAPPLLRFVRNRLVPEGRVPSFPCQPSGSVCPQQPSRLERWAGSGFRPASAPPRLLWQPLPWPLISAAPSVEVVKLLVRSLESGTQAVGCSPVTVDSQQLVRGSRESNPAWGTRRLPSSSPPRGGWTPEVVVTVGLDQACPAVCEATRERSCCSSSGRFWPGLVGERKPSFPLVTVSL